MKRNIICTCIFAMLFSLLCGCVVRPGGQSVSSAAGSGNAVSSSGGAVSSSSGGAVSRMPVSTAAESKEQESSDLAELIQEIAQNGKAAGGAFIGYIDNDGSVEAARECVRNSETGAAYPFLADAPVHLIEGQELYAIVPPSEAGRVTVFAAYIDDNYHLTHHPDQPIYEGEPGKALLLGCNISEICPNVIVSVTDGGGAYLFSPALSTENGHMSEDAGVYDFTVYQAEPDVRDIEIASEILRETEEVRDGLKRGMKLRYTGTQMIKGYPCLLFSLGTDHDDIFVQEFLYGVGDNIVYVHDPNSNEWTLLGRG